jgi:guanylate kinase
MPTSILVIGGPSCVGKDTLIKRLITDEPNRYEKVPSYCTRTPRPNEENGKTYFFIDVPTFQEKMKSGDIFEHTHIFVTYRGMSKGIIDEILSRGKIPIKEPDIIGLRALKKAYGDKIVSIFLTCPKEIIRERIKARGDSDEEIRLRLDEYGHRHDTIKEWDFTVSTAGTIDETAKAVQNILGGVEWKKKR